MIEYLLADLTALSHHYYLDRVYMDQGIYLDSGLFFLYINSKINKSLENRWAFSLSYTAISSRASGRKKNHILSLSSLGN